MLAGRVTDNFDHELIICILHRTRTDGLEVEDILVLRGRRADKSRTQQRLSDIGVRTKYLVYTQMFKEQRHVLEISSKSLP